MSEQLAQRHFGLAGKFVFGQLPALEVPIDVGIQIQLAALYETHHDCREHRLADRRGLKQGVRGNRWPTDADHSKAARPFEPALVNDRNADSRDVQILHAGRELGGVRSLAGYQYGGQEVMLNVFDSPRHVGAARDRCRADQYGGEHSNRDPLGHERLLARGPATPLLG